MADDGFKPGYQRSIGKFCSSYTQYKDELKKMGLVELGYDEMPDKKEDEPFWNKDALLKIQREHGIQLKDNEIDELMQYNPDVQAG